MTRGNWTDREYYEVIAEIKRHWATEGLLVNDGDDGFSAAVLGAMKQLGEIGLEDKNKFYGLVYRRIREMQEGDK